MPVLLILLAFLFAFLGDAVYIWSQKTHTVMQILRLRDFYLRGAGVFAATLIATVLVRVDFAAALRFSPVSLLVAALTALTASLLILLVRLHRASEREGRRAACGILLCLLLALFFEGVVCNFRTYQTMDLVPIDLTETVTVTNVGEKDEDGFYATLHPEKKIFFQCYGLDTDIKNIHLVLEGYREDAAIPHFVVQPIISDEGNSIAYTCPQKVIYTSEAGSAYIPMNPAGNCSYLRLEAHGSIDRFAIRELTLNAPRPLFFSPFRFVLILFVLCFGYAVRPHSRLYAATLECFDLKRRLVTVAVAGGFCLALFTVIASRPAFLSLIAPWQAQYQQLADAFLNGHLHLFRETPPDFLLAMDNPYDSTLRAMLAEQAGEGFYWDAAFFNGNYYVYFGVLPCLLLYLPFRALTGTDIPNDMAVFAFAVLTVAAVFMLVYELIVRFGDTKRTSFLTYLLLCLLLLSGSGLISAATSPDMYTVPILAGLGLALLGLALWLRALRGENLRRVPLFFGSLSLAAVAACRPQLLLLCVLAFPLFWGAVFRERRLFSRKSLLDSLLVLLPFLLVAVPLMWYNAARFGSPFDFGANYNLTTNDMTQRGLSVARMPLAAFCYLFQLPKVISTFPFLRYCDLDTLFRGVTVSEAVYGGIFAVCPFALFLLFLYARRARMGKRGSFAVALCLFATGVFIALFDAMAAGLLQRYFLDFSLPILLAALLVFTDIGRDARGVRVTHLRATLLALFAVSTVYRLCLFWAESGAFSYLVQFWD